MGIFAVVSVYSLIDIGCCECLSESINRSGWRYSHQDLTISCSKSWIRSLSLVIIVSFEYPSLRFACVECSLARSSLKAAKSGSMFCTVQKNSNHKSNSASFSGLRPERWTSQDIQSGVRYFDLMISLQSALTFGTPCRASTF